MRVLIVNLPKRLAKTMVPLFLLFAGLGVVTLAQAASSSDDEDEATAPPSPGDGARPGPAEGTGQTATPPPPTPPAPAPKDPTRLLGAGSLVAFAPSPVLVLPPDPEVARGVPLGAGAAPRRPLKPQQEPPRYVVEPAFAAHLLKRAQQAIGHGPLHRQALPALERAKDSGAPNQMFEAGRHWLIEAAIVGIDHGLNHIHKPDTRWSLTWIDEVLSLASLCLTEAELNPGLTFEERYRQTHVAVRRVLERPQDCWHIIRGLKADNRYWTHFLKGVSPDASARNNRAKSRCRATMQRLREEERELYAYGKRPPLRVLGQFFKRFSFLRRVTWLD